MRDCHLNFVHPDKSPACHLTVPLVWIGWMAWGLQMGNAYRVNGRFAVMRIFAVALASPANDDFAYDERFCWP